MKEKIGLVIGIIITIAVVLTLAFWLITQGNLKYTEIGVSAIIIVLLGSSVYIFWDRAKNIRKGLPAQDERLILINYKAGYYGFIAAIFSAVFGPALNDIISGNELEGSHISAIVVLVSGFVFIISYLYLAKRGR